MWVVLKSPCSRLEHGRRSIYICAPKELFEASEDWKRGQRRSSRREDGFKEFYARDGDCGKLEIDRRGRGTHVKMEITYAVSTIITLATNLRSMTLMDKVCRSTTRKIRTGPQATSSSISWWFHHLSVFEAKIIQINTFYPDPAMFYIFYLFKYYTTQCMKN